MLVSPYPVRCHSRSRRIKFISVVRTVILLAKYGKAPSLEDLKRECDTIGHGRTVENWHTQIYL